MFKYLYLISRCTSKYSVYIRTTVHNSVYIRTTVHNSAYIRTTVHNSVYIRTTVHNAAYIRTTVHNYMYIKTIPFFRTIFLVHEYLNTFIDMRCLAVITTSQWITSCESFSECIIEVQQKNEPSTVRNIFKITSNDRYFRILRV